MRGLASPTRCKTRCRWPKTAVTNIYFYGKHRLMAQLNRSNSRKFRAPSMIKVLAVGRWRSVLPISTVTCFPNSTSLTTLVPTDYCTTSQHPVDPALLCWKDDDHLLHRSRRYLVTIRSKVWALTSAI